MKRSVTTDTQETVNFLSIFNFQSTKTVFIQIDLMSFLPTELDEMSTVLRLNSPLRLTFHCDVVVVYVCCTNAERVAILTKRRNRESENHTVLCQCTHNSCGWLD